MSTPLILARMVASSAGLRLERAQIAVSQIDNAFRQKEHALKTNLTEVEARISQLNDFGPECADSLRPVSKDFSAQGYVLKLNGLMTERRQLREELSDLVAAYNHAFKSVDDEIPAPQPSNVTPISPTATVAAETPGIE